MFESLAADAALAIDSARLYRETRDKAKIEHEMALARTIQVAMLREPPQAGFAEIHALSQPARSVGGDLYFAVRPDGAVVTAVGDVSGKGVAAALIMAMAQGLLALVTDLGLPFGEMVSALDRNLATFNPGNRFLTLGVGPAPRRSPRGGERWPLPHRRRPSRRSDGDYRPDRTGDRPAAGSTVGTDRPHARAG